MMDSPLVKLILSVLLGYLVVFLILSVHDWYRAEYPEQPPLPPKTVAVQDNYYHLKAVEALDRFSRLPQPEKETLRQNLNAALIGVNEWLNRLEGMAGPVLCLGELHEEPTRRFLSQAIFDRYRVDMLLLEATPGELSRLMKKLAANRTYFPLLKADIMSLLRSVRRQNPNVEIHGIEETAQQQKENKSRSGARDRSIAENFWHHYRPGQRTVILIGALHCRDEPHWLFGRLKNQAPSLLKPELLNAWVLEPHQIGPLEAFVYFLEQVGIERAAKNFVISRSGGLPPRIKSWFKELDEQILQKYGALIVFRRQ